MVLTSRNLLTTGLSIATALAAAPAAARELSYRAPAECPSHEELASRLDRRAPAGRAARVEIEIEKRKSGFHGALVVGEGERRVARSIDARSCGAVVEALELVVALDKDDDRGDDGGSVAGDADAAGGERGPAAAPLATGASDDAHAPASGADGGADTTGAPAARARGRMPVAFGLGLSGTSFAEGQVLAGASLFADVASTDGLGGVSFLQPSLRASFTRTLPNVVPRQRTAPAASSAYVMYPADSFGPDVTLTTAALDLCPLGAGLHRSFSVVACGHGEIGSLDVGLSGSSSGSRGRLWTAGGAVSRVRLVLGDGGLRPMVEAQAGVLFPTARDRFHVDDLAAVSASAVMISGGIAAGLVLP